MDIEVKNLQVYHDAHPAATIYEAELFIDNNHTGFISFDGREENTRIIAKDEDGKKAIKAADRYCKTLATRTNADKRHIPKYFGPSLAHTVGGLISAQMEALQWQAFEKMREMRGKHSIIYGDPHTYVLGSYPLPQAISTYLATGVGKMQLTRILRDNVGPLLAEKDCILNADIPTSVILRAFAFERAPKATTKHTPFNGSVRVTRFGSAGSRKRP